MALRLADFIMLDVNKKLDGTTYPFGQGKASEESLAKLLDAEERETMIELVRIAGSTSMWVGRKSQSGSLGNMAFLVYKVSQ